MLLYTSPAKNHFHYRNSVTLQPPFAALRHQTQQVWQALYHAHFSTPVFLEINCHLISSSTRLCFSLQAKIQDISCVICREQNFASSIFVFRCHSSLFHYHLLSWDGAVGSFEADIRSDCLNTDLHFTLKFQLEGGIYSYDRRVQAVHINYKYHHIFLYDAVWSGRNLFLTSDEPSEEDNLLKYRSYNFKCHLSSYHKL
jgi:hypothetical protein